VLPRPLAWFRGPTSKGEMERAGRGGGISKGYGRDERLRERR